MFQHKMATLNKDTYAYSSSNTNMNWGFLAGWLLRYQLLKRG